MMQLVSMVALLLTVSACAELALLKTYGDDKIPGQYFIGFKDGSNFDEAVFAIESLDGNIIRKFHYMDLIVVANACYDLIEKVLSLEMVEYIEEDSIVRTQAVNVTWGLDRVDQRKLPLNNDFSPLGTGFGSHIYVIDSGITPMHRDFSGRASVAYDATRKGNGIDCNGHGTHCAGTSAGYTHGVATKAYVYGVRVLDCFGFGRKSDVVEGMRWVANNHKSPAVASVPLTGRESWSIDRAVRRLDKADVFVSVAAGNNNEDACKYSPARSRHVVTVAATTSTDRRSKFSNSGSCVDIFAPGSSITSTWYTSDTATKTKTGTSMACSFVSGAAAVHLGNGETKKETKKKLLNEATWGRIKDVRGSPNRLLYIGGGER